MLIYKTLNSKKYEKFNVVLVQSVAGSDTTNKEDVWTEECCEDGVWVQYCR